MNTSILLTAALALSASQNPQSPAGSTTEQSAALLEQTIAHQETKNLQKKYDQNRPTHPNKNGQCKKR